PSFLAGCQAPPRTDTRGGWDRGGLSEAHAKDDGVGDDEGQVGRRPRTRRVDLRRLDGVTLEATLRRTHALEGEIFSSVEPFEQYRERLCSNDARGLVLWTFEAADGQ